MRRKSYLLMTPGPTNVPNRVTRALMKPVIHHKGPEFHSLYERIVDNLRYVFQTKNEVFVLTSSGTGGTECAISNFVNSGDKVILPTFGYYSERLKEDIIVGGGKVVELPLKWGEVPTAKLIERAIVREKDVKAILLIYNSSTTGVTVKDLPEIGKISRENDLILIVDAISILGGDYLPVDEWNVDVCVAASQKCLACPPGLALISVSERAWETIRKTPRSRYFDLISARDFGSRSETPDTPAIPLFYALDESLKMIRKEGLEKRFKRHAACAKAFYSAMEALKLMPYPNEKFRSNTVIVINVPPRVDSSKLEEIMRKRYKVVIAEGIGKLRHSTFRIGCMGTISETTTLLTISALEKAFMDLRYPMEIGAGIERAEQIFH